MTTCPNCSGLKKVLDRARAAGRRLAAYWRAQAEGEEGLNEIITGVWRAEGRLEASTFDREPSTGYVRGEGPCRRCGIRAWKKGVSHVSGAEELWCVGCLALHRDTGYRLRPSRRVSA